jgi:hypothetical protein
MLGHLSARHLFGGDTHIPPSLWDMQGRQFVHPYPSFYTHYLGIIVLLFDSSLSLIV